MVHPLYCTPGFPLPAARRWLLAGVAPLALVGLGLTGCQGQSTPEAPEENAALTSPSPTAEAPKAVTEPSSTAPTEAAPATVAEAQLPDTLLKAWEPSSEVLYEFGPMTINPTQIQWAKGQSSDYTVVSSDDGYLLKLESAPSFYDTPHPYIKLIPATDASGAITDVEVAFYETEAAAKADEYIMFGSYF